MHRLFRDQNVRFEIAEVLRKDGYGIIHASEAELPTQCFGRTVRAGSLTSGLEFEQSSLAPSHEYANLNKGPEPKRQYTEQQPHIPLARCDPHYLYFSDPPQLLENHYNPLDEHDEGSGLKKELV